MKTETILYCDSEFEIKEENSFWGTSYKMRIFGVNYTIFLTLRKNLGKNTKCKNCKYFIICKKLVYVGDCSMRIIDLIIKYNISLTISCEGGEAIEDSNYKSI